jgi:hypothetical protein
MAWSAFVGVGGGFGCKINIANAQALPTPAAASVAWMPLRQNGADKFDIKPSPQAAPAVSIMRPTNEAHQGGSRAGRGARARIHRNNDDVPRMRAVPR